jgi:hypothetical protein
LLTVFTVFRLSTDFVCLYTYEFWLSLCKIVRSSVILLLPLFKHLYSLKIFSTYPKLIICDVQLKHPNTILLLRMLHQYDWLSRRKSICDWFPVLKVHIDELSSARIWQHILCATLSASVYINYRLPSKRCYRICTVKQIRIEIIRFGIKY